MSHGLVDDAFKARATESHTREWQVRSYRWDPAAGVITPMLLTLPGGKTVANIPVTSGEIVADSTDPHRRRLSMVVPGEEWIPDTPDHPLAPFGQYLDVRVRLDLPDGGHTPWLVMGQFPITGHSVERPGGLSTVTAGDWSTRVNEYGFAYNHSWKGKSRVEAIRQVVDDALPGRVYQVHATANAAKNLTEEQGQITAGTGRWDFVHHVCELTAIEAFFDRFGDLVIRNEIVDYEGYVPGAGADIGSETNPVAHLVEGPRGSIVALSPSVSRENAANGVFIQVKPTQSGKGSAYRAQMAKAVTSSGPATFGDRFGRITLHRTKEVAKVTAEVMESQRRHAAGLLSRRQGVIRRLLIEALPLWWLDPDDRVNVTWRQRMPDNTERVRTETHYVESVAFPFEPDGLMRLATRQVAVVELSEPWTPEPEPNPDYVPPVDESAPPALPPTLPPAPPVKVPAPDLVLLDRWRDRLRENPWEAMTHRSYGKVTSIVRGDLIEVDFYADAACTKRTTQTHPAGGSYQSGLVGLVGVSAPQAGWYWDAASRAALAGIIGVGSRVALRADSNVDLSVGGSKRFGRDVHPLNADGTRRGSAAVYMLDGGWLLAWPMATEPRNARNHIWHMAVAAWKGLGMFADPAPQHATVQVVNVLGNPEGADTSRNEWVELRNVGGQPVDLAGWLFGDPNPAKMFTFPAGAVLSAGQTARVHVGPGVNNPPAGRY